MEKKRGEARDERVKQMEQIETHSMEAPEPLEKESLSPAHTVSDVDGVKAKDTKSLSSPEKPWGQTINERWSDEGAAEEKGGGDESEYPDPDIIHAIGEASPDPEGVEGTG